MNSMYGHYRNAQKMGREKIGNSKRDRIRNIVIAVLVATVLVLTGVCAEMIRYRNEAHAAFANTMRNECNSAIVQTNSLSRTAGADSPAILGRIRSHVRTMDTINQINAALEHGDQYLVAPSVFENLYTILDNYSSKLVSGMVTGGLQTELQTSLDTLVMMIQQLN